MVRKTQPHQEIGQLTAYREAAERVRRGDFRLLALDVDGTLLDRSGVLQPSTVAAVARAAAAGIRPVLCTGRRYRRARHIAEQLGLDAPIVCNSGAIVKEPSSHRTLWRADFDMDVFGQLLSVFRQNVEPIVSFTDLDPQDPDFLVEVAETGRQEYDDYLLQNLSHAGVWPGWPEEALSALAGASTSRLGPFTSGGHFHICAIGTQPAMAEFGVKVRAQLGDRVQTFVQRSPRYLGTMCEIIRGDASKWEAVLHVAELWNVQPQEIIAVGDDMNDLPMIAGAGLGVAMGHAPEPVLAAADHVTGDHDNDGVAMLVDLILGQR